jgi:hypothetical protein
LGPKIHLIACLVAALVRIKSAPTRQAECKEQLIQELTEARNKKIFKKNLMPGVVDGAEFLIFIFILKKSYCGYDIFWAGRIRNPNIFY